MKINLKNKYILILLCTTLLVPVFCSIQNAVANQHIVGNNIKFTYPDGSWFGVIATFKATAWTKTYDSASTGNIDGVPRINIASVDGVV